MSAIVDKYAAVARVWSGALLALAAEAGPRFDPLLTSPLVDDEDKRRLIESVLRGRASDLVVDALQVMRRKGRLELLRVVVTAYEQDWMRRRNRVEVTVTSAIPLDDELRAEIRLAAAERTNHQPVLVERIDRALVGGMVVEIGDEKIDSSIRRELQKIEESLLARASHELLSGKSYVIENS
jgi:F-type H+-transporting ATPase subunit delta